MRLFHNLVTLGLLAAAALNADGCKTGFSGMKRIFGDCMKPLLSGVVQSPAHVIDYVIEDSKWYEKVKNNICKDDLNTPECWISSLIFLLDESSPVYHFTSTCICKYAGTCKGFGPNGVDLTSDMSYIYGQSQPSKRREFTATATQFSDCVARDDAKNVNDTLGDSISNFLSNHYTYCRSDLIKSYSFAQRLIFRILYLSRACPRQNVPWRENITQVYEDATRTDSPLWETIATCKSKIYGESDPCIKRSCAANSQCVRKDGLAVCECKEGFKPASDGTCQAKELDPCNEKNCPPAEKCFAYKTRAYCLCQAGHKRGKSGKCEDPCEPNPCRNGGTCEKPSGGTAARSETKCTCLPSYAGKYCEIEAANAGGVEKYCLQIKSADADRDDNDPEWLKKFVDSLGNELKLIWSSFLGFVKVDARAKYITKPDGKIQATITATVWVSSNTKNGSIEDSDLVEHFVRSSAPKARFSGEPTPCTKRSGRATCRVWGNSRYTTFDGNKAFTFTGMCSYIMSETKTLPTTDSRWLRVVARNELRDSTTSVPFLKEVVVLLSGGNTTIELQKDGTVLVNGVSVTEANSPFFSIARPGRNIVVTTLHGVSISFIGDTLHIKAPKSYMNMVSGLCSNYNGNSRDELTMDNGKVAMNYSDFASSYPYDDCNIPLTSPVTCSESDRIKWSSDDYCGMFLKPQNAVSDCYAAVDSQIYFDSCIFDACATGHHAALEQNLGLYVTDCKDSGIDICDWRQRTGLPRSRCPNHSSYAGCASTCQDTCFNPNASKSCEDSATVEMCVCDSGYVRDGARCVKRSECGCVKDFLYYMKGQGYQSDNEICVCRGQNNIECVCKTGYEYDGMICKKIFDSCSSAPCKNGGRCSTVGSVYACECAEGFTGNSCQTTVAESTSPCDSHTCKNGGACVAAGDSYTCLCRSGFSGRNCQRAPRCSGNKIYTECASRCVDSCVQQFVDCLLDCDPNSHCACPPGMVERTMGSSRCIALERCPPKLVREKRDGLAVCKAWGDPHYQTFDGGPRYEFMGACKYVMSEAVGIPKSNSRWFMVVAENGHRFNETDVSWLKTVSLSLHINSTVITLDRNGVVVVNGNEVLESDNDDVQILKSTRGVIVTTKYGVSVSFNGDAMRIKVPESYMHKLAGLCGNYNGDPDDDLIMEDGNMASNFSEFAISFQYGECEDTFVPTFKCPEQNKTQWSDSKYCGMLLEPTGVFSDCYSSVDPQMYFDACVIDMCATDGNMDAMESAFTVYASECLTNEVSLCDWRMKTGVRQFSCPEFSSYDGCANACQDTCLNPRATASCKDDGIRVEDCVCDPGYIREGGKCVQKIECGCGDDGFYYKLGQFVRFNQASCVCAATNFLNCSCQIGYELVGNTCVETILEGLCSVKRAETMASGFRGFVPICDAVGNFQKKQCESGTCFCVDEFTGVKIEGTDRISEEALTLDCNRLSETCQYIRASAIASQKSPDFIPACDEEGNYLSEQCVAASGTCFCVDKLTGEINEDTRRPIGSAAVECAPGPGGMRDNEMIEQHCLQIRSVDSPGIVDDPNWFNVFVSELTSDLKLIWQSFPGFMRGEFGAEYQIKQNETVQATITMNIWLDLTKTRRSTVGAKDLIRHYVQSPSAIKIRFDGKPAECSKEIKEKDPCHQRFDRKCSRHATCLMDSDGEHSCVCIDGYTGDGLKCKRTRDRRATCRIWGDPHYSTFDKGELYDFMGMCSYVISEALVSETEERWFRIVAENEIRDNVTGVSYVKSSTLFLHGEDYVITIDKFGTVTVNGNNVIEAETPMYKIERKGEGVAVTTASGVCVYFNGDALRVRLPETYKNQVMGLCGNYNGIPEDELVMENGELAENFNTFATSHQYGECDIPIPPPVQCSESDRIKWSGDAYCGQLTNETKAFWACRGVVDSQQYFKSCVFDLCATGGNMETLLNVLREYVNDCQTNGIDLCDWRQKAGVKPMACPEHSTYSGCASACQDTCFKPSAGADCEDTSRTEACVCDEGYILEGTKCVRLSECGCVQDFSYYERGEVAYFDSQVCTCESRMNFLCKCIAGYEAVGGNCKLTHPIESCALRRAELEVAGNPDAFIPECNSGGDYVRKQCYQFTDQCSCVDEKTGRALEETTTDSLEFTWDCDRLPENCQFRNAIRAAAGIEDKFIPRCDDDGDYDTEQCDDDGGTCFCVDRGTGYEVNGTKASQDDFDLDCDNLPPSYGKCIDEYGKNCHERATCQAIRGGFQCVCDKGYTGDGYTCIGRDECEVTFLKKCHQKADCKRNADGNYNCVCNTGFVGDGFDCRDEKKECQDKVGSRCHRYATCVIGEDDSYACKCKKGYVGNGLSCKKISPCQELEGTACHENARCQRLKETYRCKCKRGYQGNGRTCVRLDRCVERFGLPCHENADCGEGNNTGSPLCRCRSGYTGDGLSCKEISECHKIFKQQCDVNAECQLVGAAYRCQCVDGYRGNGFSCKKISLCEIKSGRPCHPDAECVTDDLDTHSCQCKEKFWGDGKFCGSGDPPSNPCHRRFGRECHSDATCEEVMVRLHECRCPEGQIGDGFECQEMDRRLCFINIGRPCAENAYCTKSGETYTCTCRLKFFGDGFYCDSGGWVDGCHKNFGRQCSNLAQCDEEGTEYACRCGPGYTGDGFACLPRPTQAPQLGKTDRNKLRARYPCYFKLGHFCHQYATCSKTKGQYECHCWMGFYGDGLHCQYRPYESCQQIYGRACSQKAVCSMHSSGQYQCQCTDGHFGNGFFCLADPKNQCERRFGRRCHSNAQCLNREDRGYECVCNSNYTGDGFSCQMHSGCYRQYGIECHPSADCKERGKGYYVCQCRNEYVGNGFNCREKNECRKQLPKPCHKDAFCDGTGDDFQCRCRGGYEGDGVTVCRETFCQRPTDINNGVVYPQQRNYRFSQVIMYVCQQGHDMIGSATRKCLTDNAWDGEEPTCSKDDRQPGQYEDGCHEYYQIPCNPNGECKQVDGVYRCSCRDNFVGDGFHCQGILDRDRCATQLGRDCHLNAECQINSLGRHQCFCRTGYIGNGFICEGPCYRPRDIVHGRIVDAKDHYKIYQSVAYQCNEGYQLEGSMQRTCLPNSTWTGFEPACIRLTDNCVAKYSRSCHEEADCISAEEGYTCVCRKGYTGDGINCKKVNNDIEIRETLQPGDVATMQDCRNYFNQPCTIFAECHYLGGTSFRCVCKEGYTGDGFECSKEVKVQCQRPNNIPQGRIATNNKEYTLNTVITYSCLPGYVLNGEAKRTCEYDSLWSGFTPRCIMQDTERFGSQDNHKYSSGITREDCEEKFTKPCHEFAECRLGKKDQLECQCRQGFKGNGFDCKTSSVSGAQRESAICNRPQDIAFGTIKTSDSSYKTGTVITYSCQKTYQMVGEASRSCDENGRWSGDQPTCERTGIERRPCQEPQGLQDGRAIPSDRRYRDQSHVIYRCNKGYVLDRDERRTCQNGKWSGIHPRCIRL